MAKKVLRGTASITLVDLTDGRQLVSHIHTNLQKQVIYDPDKNIYTPDYNTVPMILTPQLRVYGASEDQIVNAKSITWYLQENSTGPMNTLNTSDSTYVLGTGNKSLSITKNIFTELQSLTVMCEIVHVDPVTKQEYLAISEIELGTILNGSNAVDPILASLTNDFHIVQTKEDGTGGIFTGAETRLNIYQGAIDVTTSYKITATPSTGVVGTYLEGLYKVVALAEDRGSITFEAKRSGYPTLKKVFTLNKIRNGKDGTLTTLEVSHQIIKKDSEGNYETKVLTVMGMKKVGDAQPEPYQGIFKIYVSRDGENFGTPVIVSNSPEYTLRYNVPEQISAIRAELYYPDGTFLVDSEVVHIVLDGADAMTMVINTPEGIIIHNKERNIKAEVMLYSGSQTVLATSYRWYRRNPDSLGDEQSGKGWEYLNASNPKGTSGYTTAVLIITPEAITGGETFLCVATYKSRNFRSTVTVTDITDPYSVVILGSGTFKNGMGENSFTCKVYQNGLELPALGYSYSWSIYNGTGALDPSFNKTGKTITVKASDFKDSSVISCVVDDNT